MATKKHCFRCKKRTLSKRNIKGEDICLECGARQDVYYETPYGSLLLLFSLLIAILGMAFGILYGMYLLLSLLY